MKMKAIVGSLLAAVLGCGSSSSWAEGSSSAAPAARVEMTAPPASSAWKASTTSNYFALDGTQAANRNAYSFGHVQLYAQNLELSYAASPQWKFLARAKYLNNTWDVRAGGKSYAEQTTGLGDTLVGAVHPLIVSPNFKLIADGGVFLPTGSIDEANGYVANQHYKYFLQLGSGTIDETLGVTALAPIGSVQPGSRVSTILRNGHNANGYQVGNVARVDSWLDWPLAYGFKPRVVGYYRWTRPMNGFDPKVNRAAAEIYYHESTDWSVSPALKYEHAFGPTLALDMEFGVPVLQGMKNYDNVVVSTRYYGSLSLAGQF